ncbi:beta-ketoacyl reductase, partial [Pseudoalteromonas holothuriae]|uniref:beta-ketoacyl reductase n=1 Tax=Pseudoalteromonas holothuriae TaxID=2963714 RepID=UPI0021BEECC3
LGQLFAHYLASQAKVNLILTGRRAIEQAEPLLAQLRAKGSEATYIEADVSDLDAMRAGLAQARSRFGAIHGVLHTAGVESTQGFVDKDVMQMYQVLSAKVRGTQVLDALVTEPELKFMCYFSSSSAILGDFGSCDYAIGNRYQMAYGHYREQRVAAGDLSGQTWVVNWPLWTSGGMGQSQAQSRKLYLQSSGQEGLSNEAGLEVFAELLAGPSVQRLILVGERERTEQIVKALEQPIKIPVQEAEEQVRSLIVDDEQEEALALALDKALKRQVSELLKIPDSELEDDENLVDYGFDSLGLASFAERLSVLYQLDITPAVFFSHSNLGLLRKHLISSYGEQLRAHYGLGVETTAQTKLTRDVVTKHTGSQEDECLV